MLQYLNYVTIYDHIKCMILDNNNPMEKYLIKWILMKEKKNI